MGPSLEGCDAQDLSLDGVEVHEPKPTREFEKHFCIQAWNGDLPPKFANEYGPGMARRIALWWSARTAAGGQQVRWISFVHLYVDYQQTWGCAGPLQHKKAWLDMVLRPYVDATQYPFLKRLRWFRRCLKQFWLQSKQLVGLAQCRCESEIIQTHIASASVCWDAATHQLAENWLAEHCAGPVARGTRMLQSLPTANAVTGLRLVHDASQDAAESATVA